MGEDVSVTVLDGDDDAFVRGLVEVVGQRVEVQPGGLGEHRHRRGVQGVTDHRCCAQHRENGRIQRRQPPVEHRPHSPGNFAARPFGPR